MQFTDRHSASYYYLFQITIGILKLKPEDFFLLENFFESVAQSNLTTPYKKREWAEMVFAVVKKDGARKYRPQQNATENTRKKEKAQKLKICRRAKNYGAIRQAV